MTRAGQQDRQFSVERPVSTPDATYGTPVISWVPLVALPGSPVVAARWWGEFQDVLPSRAESVRMGLDVARNQTRLRTRWRSDIDSSMRIVLYGDADVIYQIIAGPAEIDGRKERIEFMLERFSS